MASPRIPIRRGIAKNLTLDLDAWAMLLELAPTSKSYGRYLSELIRRDYHWHQWEKARTARPELVEVASE